MSGKEKAATAVAAIAAAGILFHAAFKPSPALQALPETPEALARMEWTAPYHSVGDNGAAGGGNTAGGAVSGGSGAGGGMAFSVPRAQSRWRMFLWKLLAAFALALALLLWGFGCFLLFPFSRRAFFFRFGLAAALPLHFAGWPLLGAAAALAFYAALRFFYPALPLRFYRLFPVWDAVLLCAAADAALFGILAFWLCLPVPRAYFPVPFFILCRMAAIPRYGAAVLLAALCAASVARERRRVWNCLWRQARRRSQEWKKREDPALEARKRIEAAARALSESVCPRRFR